MTLFTKAKASARRAGTIANDLMLDAVDRTSNFKVSGKAAGTTAVVAAASSMTKFYALDALVKKAQTMSKEVYKQAMTVANYVGIVLVVVALLLRLSSKNPRSIEMATGWIRNIAITWIIIRLLPLIVTALGGFFEQDDMKWDI